MGRELWLLRHGKAVRYDGSEDYDRPLKKRGKRDAKNLAKWLKERHLVPDIVISSPAVRANMTAAIVCDVLGLSRQELQMEKRLYDEGLTRVRGVLSDCPDEFKRVLLVGHNPELEELLAYLARPESLPDVKKLLPTAALARLAMPDSWKKLDKGCAGLLAITTPKALPGGVLEPPEIESD